MNIDREETEGKGSFFIIEDGRQVALMTHAVKEHSILVILHTEVHDALKGKDVGSKLVTEAVNYARENDLLIRPLCTFAKAVIDKKQDHYADVLEQAT